MLTRLKAGKHNCLGMFDSIPEIAPEAPVPNQLDVPTLMVYEGEFQSADGSVEITAEIIDRLVREHNGLLTRMRAMLGGGIPVKMHPPLQVDHSTSAMMTVGRVVGELRRGLYTLTDGRQVVGLFGTIRVLGRENVEKVLDGRWAQVSIGADLATGVLAEASITPFPAAPEASTLAGKVETDAKLSEGKGSEMHEKLRKHLMEECKMSAEQADEMMGRLRKHLKAKKMSDEEVETKLSGMTTDEYTSMSAEMEEHEKLSKEKSPKAGEDLDEQEEDEPEHKEEVEKLSNEKTEEAEVKEEKVAMSAAGVVRLSADQKSALTKLAKDFRAQGTLARLKARETSLTVRLSGLRASAKITPAEIKKLDLAKLAAASEETVEAVLKSYELREPVILPGILGTAKATNIAQLSAEIQKQALAAETLENMPSLQKSMEATGKLKKAEESKNSRLSSEATLAAQESDPTLAGIFGMMDGGKTEAAKAEIKKVVAKLSAGGYAGMTESPKETETQISALADSVKSMQNQFDELMKLVGPILGVEGSDL